MLGSYLAIKKNEIICNMEGSTKGSKTEKDKYYVIPLTCSLKYDTNELFAKQKQTHRYREQI